MLSLFNIILYIFIILGIKTCRWKLDRWNPHKWKYVGWTPTSIFSQTCFKFIFFSFIPILTQCCFCQCNLQRTFAHFFLGRPLLGSFFFLIISLLDYLLFSSFEFTITLSHVFIFITKCLVSFVSLYFLIFFHSN